MPDIEMLKEHANRISRYVFYEKRSSAGWLENHSVEPILVYGSIPDKAPKCTVVIPTYKRPFFLKRAIGSVLNQKGYEDFVIIIADNEGAPISEKTKTQELIENIGSDKILYFRYSRSISSYNNAAASLVFSKWFLILHDDDVLQKNTLRFLITAIERKPDIDMLCVQHKVILNDDENGICDFIDSDKDGSIICRKISFDETIFVHKNEYTGALFRTDAYIDSGGIPEVGLGCGDIVFASIFNAFYNRYYLESDFYGSILHKNNISAVSDDWYPSVVTKYYWYKAALRRKYGENIKAIQETLIRAFFLRGIQATNEGYKHFYGPNWEIDECIITDCVGIPLVKQNQLFRRNIYKLFIRLWNLHIKIIERRMIRTESFQLSFKKCGNV